MKNIFLILLLFTSVHAVMAQASKVINQKTQQNLDELSTLSSHNVVNTFDERYEGVRGTPFLHENWKSGTIKIQDNVFQNISVKYNIYTNSLLYKNDGALFMLDLNKVDYFDLADSLNLFSQNFRRVSSIVNISPKLNNKFAHVIYDGKKTKLLNISSKDYVKADYKGTYSSGKNYDEFRDNNLTYFINSAGAAEKVKLNKRTLVNLLKDRKEEIEKFISQEQLKTETEAGWSKVLAYYEKL